MRYLIAFAMLCALAGSANAHPRHHRHHYQHRHEITAPDFAVGLGYGLLHQVGSGIQPHPAGCPRIAFCGCGTSERVYGHPVRNLFLAANWFKFPRAFPAHGMVAVRRHHVFYIENVNSDGTVVAYDPNSGGHLTRLHTVSLSGYVVVRPE